MISSNRANDAGAGFYVENSTPLIVNTLISGNHANFGAGVTLTQGSHARLVNVTIAGNRAGDSGGAMRNSSSNPTILNSIIYGNNSGISNNSSNPNISYSLVQNRNDSNNGNLNADLYDPGFVNPLSNASAPILGGDYSLRAGSPCINAGNKNELIAAIQTDIAGNTRIHNGQVEMGAYEISCIASKVLYVDSSVAVSGNGLSWAQAFKTLKEATFMAEVCPNVDSILVAKGTYYPTGARTETNRDASFVISRGLSLIGGYPSGGGQPNAGVNTTILSGDINVPNDNTDNSYHVLVLAGIPAGQTAYVDGFKIIWGNASGSNDFPYNSQFLNRNQGGGIVTKNVKGQVYVRNCIISANRASDAGGGIANIYSKITFISCLISGNHANFGGGVLDADSSNINYIGCTIASNRAGETGGAIRTSSSNTRVNNSILFANSNGISNNYSTVYYGYSLIQGYNYYTSGMIVANNNWNVFRNPLPYSQAPSTEGDYLLVDTSRCINSGSHFYYVYYSQQATILSLPYSQNKKFITFNRSWNINSSNIYDQPISVRFYFSQTDSNDIATVIPFDSIQQLILYKVNGSNVWDSMAVNYKEYTFGNEADTSHFVLGEYQGIKYAEFQLKSFSSGTMAFITDDAVLPLDLLSFTAVNMDSRVLLQWHTVNEVDVSHFEVERGKDARVWELLNIQTAKNGIENHYTQWDEQPFSDISYYRLKMIDLDGTYKYSKIVQVGQDKNVIPVCKVYPNPSSGNIFVQWNSNEAHAIMTVYDASGAKIHLQLLDNGVNAIDLSHLPGGLYGLNIISNQYELSQKLILE